VTVSVLQIIGTVLIVAGVVELPLFRYLGRRRPTIARRRTLFAANALLNVVLGALFFMAGW
jgi:hypothetical protein